MNFRKKIIIFVSGYKVINNQYYFGYYRNGTSVSLWKDQFDIIKLLTNYVNDYEIYYKDYSYGDRYFKKIIDDVSYGRIKYIDDSDLYKKLLKKSSLNILNYGSTVFFESLYYNSDIFLYEPDIINKFNYKLHKNYGVFVYKNMKYFMFYLKNYLKNKVHKKKDKLFLRKIYLSEDIQKEVIINKIHSIKSNVV
jgi:hypothetical protein